MPECSNCRTVIQKEQMICHRCGIIKPITMENNIPNNTFQVYVRQAGIRCPKCGVLLITGRLFEKGERVKCTNQTMLDDKFNSKSCDFEGEVEYPKGVNFV